MYFVLVMLFLSAALSVRRKIPLNVTAKFTLQERRFGTKKFITIVPISIYLINQSIHHSSLGIHCCKATLNSRSLGLCFVCKNAFKLALISTHMFGGCSMD